MKIAMQQGVIGQGSGIDLGEDPAGNLLMVVNAPGGRVIVVFDSPAEAKHIMAQIGFLAIKHELERLPGTVSSPLSADEPPPAQAPSLLTSLDGSPLRKRPS